MDLQFGDDHNLLAATLDRILAPHRAVPESAQDFWLSGEALRGELAEHGFLDVAAEPGLGRLGALILIDRVCQLPVATEVAASALVAPGLGLVPQGAVVALAPPQPDAAIRFLQPGALVLLQAGGQVCSLVARQDESTPVASDYAYPFAQLAPSARCRAQPVPDARPERLLALSRLALAAEMLGTAQAALDLTVGYVRQRRQFGRAIGSFQSLQHRLAECAVMLEGLRPLCRKAAWSGDPLDAALAATWAQGIGSRIVHETQQLHGAIGLTLEYPLHYWGYRMRCLLGELGGADRQAADAADLLWPG